jgi:zinc transport system ATP-binding protein
MNSTALITVNNVSLRFGQNTILHCIDLSILPNQIVTLIGPNGAGKTSLVRLVIGLTKPTSGSIDRQPNLRIGYVPQKMAIDPSLPMRVKNFLSLVPHAKTNISTVLAQVGGAHLNQHFLHTLSGGELQRVLLARALLHKPDLLVLDEPVQGVDLRGQAELYQLIQTVRDQYDCAILMVSHDLHWVMAATDHVLCLNQHVCCSGHPEHVSQNPAYIELFGHAQIAPYTHHHDHHHDVHGNVIAEHDHSSCAHGKNHG